MELTTNDRDHPRAHAFQNFVRNRPFPCVGAKSALSRGTMSILVARNITSNWDDMRIYPALLAFIAGYRASPDLFQSFVVVFEGPNDLDEEGFERNLWERAQSLSDKDGWLGRPRDPRVAADPDSPHFSLSFGGEAFFIVGLHLCASRPARRFSSPALVFNLHAQFERLRAEGRYEKLRASILDRDVSLAGSVNPMLARHGEVSEARQYSGRAVGDDWRCPLENRDVAPYAATAAGALLLLPDGWPSSMGAGPIQGGIMGDTHDDEADPPREPEDGALDRAQAAMSAFLAELPAPEPWADRPSPAYRPLPPA